MASVHTNSWDGRTITLSVVEESWSIETNTSVVRWTLTSGTSSTYHNVYEITAWVNGTDNAHKVYGPKTATWESRAFPCKDGSTTGTVTIQHNNDGTASPVPFRLRGSVRNNNPQNYDSSITLTTIPRATTNWSISGNTIGSNVTVTLVPNSSSFTHRVICYFGNDSQELSVASNQQSASATLKMAFCNQVPNATSGSGTMVVETYNGGQLIGSDSKSITLYVPNNVVPSISSVTKSDTSNLVGTYGAYVQGKSNLRIQTSANGSYSSTIANVTVNIKDSNYNLLRQLTGDDVTLSNISYVGTLNIEVIVTDSRGRQASNTSQINVVEYFNPRINSFTAERRDNDSTVTITFSADICNINNNNVNSKEFRLYKRQKGTSSWGSPILTYNSAYSYSRNDFTTTCDENYGWEFLLQAQDSFTTTSNDNPEVGTAFELINWKDDGTAMAIGKVSEKSNTFEVALNTEIDGVAIINTPQDVWTGIDILPSNRNESSIAYHNPGNTTRAVVGWGTSSFDGFGIYMDDIAANALTVARNGNVTLNKKLYYGNDGREDYAPYGFIYDGAGNMRHKRIDGGDNFGIDRYDGARMFYYWPESGKILNNGDVEINGSLKTSKFFIYQLQANYYGEARYYKLAYLPPDSGANACQVNIKGSMGNWTTAKATIDVQISNRDGLFFYGSYIGHRDTFGSQQIRIFREDNGGHTIYLYTDPGYTGPNTFEITGSGFSDAQPTIFTDYSYTTSPSGQWVQTTLKENMVNVSNSDLGSFSCNKDSGNGNVTSAYYWVKGELVQLEITFNTSGGTTAVGGNVWKGTLSGIPLPKGLVSGCGFYSSTLYVGSLETNGTFTIRVLGTTSAQNTGGHVISVVYIRQ